MPFDLRRQLLAAIPTLAALCPIAAHAAAHSQSEGSAAAASGAYDVWIRNGSVVDGTGHPRYTADVLIRGDQISYVGTVAADRISAKRVVDATGKIVTPGFIDAHSHGDPLSQSFSNFLGQGITTVLLGQDGASGDERSRSKSPPLSDWMSRVEKHGSEVNIATLSGHGSLRMQAGVGDAPQPSTTQLQAMEKTLQGDLDAGAFGLSFGLEYEPGRYAQLPEEKALGDLVGRNGGVVMSHMRSEDSDKIAAAIDELLQINAHVHVSHIKIVAGHRPEEAQAVLAQFSRARAQGKEVTADVYPYLASASDLVFLYPDWAKRQSDYNEAVKHRRPELEAHIRKRVEARNGPAAILLTDGPYAGQTVADLAQRLGKPYEKVMIDDLGYGGPGQAHFLMSAAVQDLFITAEHICFSTDGAPGAHHPRAAASFVKVLEEYVGPPPKMSLEQAVHKMSDLAAEIIGLTDRGVIATGKKADLLVLSPAELHSRASWLKPQLRPSGIDAILVNGQFALDQGQVSSTRHGRLLRSDRRRQA